MTYRLVVSDNDSLDDYPLAVFCSAYTNNDKERISRMIKVSRQGSELIKSRRDHPEDPAHRERRLLREQLRRQLEKEKKEKRRMRERLRREQKKRERDQLKQKKGKDGLEVPASTEELKKEEVVDQKEDEMGNQKEDEMVNQKEDEMVDQKEEVVNQMEDEMVDQKEELVDQKEEVVNQMEEELVNQKEEETVNQMNEEVVNQMEEETVDQKEETVDQKEETVDQKEEETVDQKKDPADEEKVLPKMALIKKGLVEVKQEVPSPVVKIESETTLSTPTPTNNVIVPTIPSAPMNQSLEADCVVMASALNHLHLWVLPHLELIKTNYQSIIFDLTPFAPTIEIQDVAFLNGFDRKGGTVAVAAKNGLILILDCIEQRLLYKVGMQRKIEG